MASTIGRALNNQHVVYQSGTVFYKKSGSDAHTPVFNDTGLPVVLKEDPGKVDLTIEPSIAYGVPSIINPYALLAFPSIGPSFNQIVDDPHSATKFSSPLSKVASTPDLDNIEPTAYNLVNTPPDGAKDAWHSKMPYRYTDFLYSKYYGVIPNNQLITLRRYPAPAYDNLGIPLEVGDNTSEWKSKSMGRFMPIAQAITYLGEEPENKISDLLGFEVKMNWKEHEANAENIAGNEQSSDEGPSMFNGIAKVMTIMTGTVTGEKTSAYESKNSQYDPYANGPYSHRVFGPVNTISKTFKRDRGLEFKQTFNVNFHYQLKSIGNINPKAAMLDIMSNMLQLTYNNAAFWGGANRYFPQRPVYPFIGGKAGMNAWYRGQPLEFVTAVSNQIASVAKDLSEFFKSLMSDPISALKQLASNGASMAMAMMGNGRAPDVVGMKALLTGEPIGEWHMVVGNPYSPTLMIGNLICRNAKFTFSDVLGADNFPTELKVTITLDHGRMRDKGDIESMFNAGEGRIYYAPMKMEHVFDSSAQANSLNDTTGGKPAPGTSVNQQNEVPSASKSKGNVARKFRSGRGRNIGYLGMSYLPGTGEFDSTAQTALNTYHTLASMMGIESAGVKSGTTPAPKP